MKRSGAPRRKKQIKRGAPPKRKTQLRAKAELRTTSTPQRRKRLNKVSERKREADKEFEQNRLLAKERADGRCEIGMKAWGCVGIGTDAHHVLQRSQGGSHDLSNLMWLCSPCHIDGVHGHIEFSIQRGWLRSGHEQFGKYVVGVE